MEKIEFFLFFWEIICEIEVIISVVTLIDLIKRFTNNVNLSDFVIDST